ncbi:hypothetical protein C8A00DRAFT_13122 [Chaetomidium leptoderma]|uniref:Uncharacterized protein n=1 Tax=Chaetomidium leptoderma TaxID=669021 RepID=A0AAN6VQT3_9PEZI|nr:hypothetical protein C8A00DRAFT_13122 [Chaetomidium leptoderma]
MRFNIRFIKSILLLRIHGVIAEINQCPDTELACHDIMNSSQCIAGVVQGGSGSVTKEAMVKCVEHEGTASNLPGAVKVSIQPCIGGCLDIGLIKDMKTVLSMPGLSHSAD